MSKNSILLIHLYSLGQLGTSFHFDRGSMTWNSWPPIWQLLQDDKEGFDFISRHVQTWSHWVIAIIHPILMRLVPRSRSWQRWQVEMRREWVFWSHGTTLGEWKGGWKMVKFWYFVIPRVIQKVYCRPAKYYWHQSVRTWYMRAYRMEPMIFPRPAIATPKTPAAYSRFVQLDYIIWLHAIVKKFHPPFLGYVLQQRELYEWV